MADLRDRLEEVLQRPAVTVADAERAARAAEALAAYLRLEEQVGRLGLDGETGQQPADHPATEGGLEGMTLHRAAEEVLREAKVPLHVRELGKRIKAGGWRHKRSVNPQPDQINFQLAARLPRQPQLFVRVAPNTFALKEWEHAVQAQPRPRVGLFRGSGKPVAREIGDDPEIVAASAEWRSS